MGQFGAMRMVKSVPVIGTLALACVLLGVVQVKAGDTSEWDRGDDAAVCRDFSDGLVARLASDFDKQQSSGRRTPSMDQFRRQFVCSSDVVDASVLLPQIQMSQAFLSHVTRPSVVQEEAMNVVVQFGLRRHAELRREIASVEFPEGPDHLSEFQPRPQPGGATDGSFSDFRSEEEKLEYERNYQLMLIRNEFKVYKFWLEQDLRVIERDLSRLLLVIDSACDVEGRQMLRRMLREASLPGLEYVDLFGLPNIDD